MNNNRRDFFKKLGFGIAGISTFGILGSKAIKNLQVVPPESMALKNPLKKLNAKWSVEADQDLQSYYNLRVEDVCMANMSKQSSGSTERLL